MLERAVIPEFVKPMTGGIVLMQSLHNQNGRCQYLVRNDSTSRNGRIHPLIDRRQSFVGHRHRRVNRVVNNNEMGMLPCDVAHDTEGLPLPSGGIPKPRL